MKKLLIYLVAALLLLSGVLGSCGARSDPPELYEIYDEAVALIEASYAVNDALFGHGLPVVEIGSEYAERINAYGSSDFANYEVVTTQTPYRSIDEIKAALSAVYSKDYVESLSSNLFDGFVAGTVLVHAQFREDAEGLYLLTTYAPLVTWHRVYDYSTMRIIEPSSADYVNIEIESHLENESETLTVALALVLEDGEWRLDTPTY